VQNFFQDSYLSFLMVLAYSALVVRYCSFHCSRRAVLPFVRRYLLLCAFTFFLRIVRFCVHQGTGLCCTAFLVVLVGLVSRKEDLQALSRASWS
jgi:hypothetical protein